MDDELGPQGFGDELDEEADWEQVESWAEELAEPSGWQELDWEELASEEDDLGDEWDAEGDDVPDWIEPSREDDEA